MGSRDRSLGLCGARVKLRISVTLLQPVGIQGAQPLSQGLPQLLLLVCSQPGPGGCRGEAGSLGGWEFWGG